VPRFFVPVGEEVEGVADGGVGDDEIEVLDSRSVELPYSWMSLYVMKLDSGIGERLRLWHLFLDWRYLVNIYASAILFPMPELFGKSISCVGMAPANTPIALLDPIHAIVDIPF
jgi:hypothetical protein